MKGFLTEEQIKILREAHYSCRLRKSADRIKAILLLTPITARRDAVRGIKSGLNLNGTLNLSNVQVTVLEEKTINTDAMINLCATLEKKQQRGALYLVMDNARDNHSKDLTEKPNSPKRVNAKMIKITANHGDNQKIHDFSLSGNVIKNQVKPHPKKKRRKTVAAE